jgi:hypothetical protein
MRRVLARHGETLKGRPPCAEADIPTFGETFVYWPSSGVILAVL